LIFLNKTYSNNKKQPNNNIYVEISILNVKNQKEKLSMKKAIFKSEWGILRDKNINKEANPYESDHL
jgi:hypothetical protein